MALVDMLVTDFSALRSIARGPGAGGRAALTANYLRLRAKYVLFTRLLGSKRKTEQVLGHPVTAGSYSNIVYLFTEIFVNSEYGFTSSTDAPTIIDCGANIGMATLYFKTLYPRSRITAFEPAPASFACLKRNVGHLDGVEVRNQAVAGSPGTLDFVVDQGQETSLISSASTTGRLEGKHISVEAAILSTVINGPVHFLKMDIEGAEFEALEELERSGKMAFVEQMAVEYHHNMGNASRDHFSRFLSLLERNGFGYQLRGSPVNLYERGAFQDVLVYAYRPA